MRTIRASEIVNYSYCQRAWWYQKLRAHSDNQVEMADGVELHHRHGLATMQIGCLRYLAFTLILLGVILMLIYYIPQLL